MKPRFTIITPCWNAAAYIEETALSILQQTAVLGERAELEYIVCDGGSTDRTVDILGDLQHPALRVYSEPDQGMYDALAKGLRRASGHFIAYLNAGDYYHKCAFDVVADVFARYPAVHWLTGLSTLYNERSQIVTVEAPFRYRRQFFENGFHGTHLPGLQQESTFWRAELLPLIDFERLASLRLAGDFFLWQQFARQHEVITVHASISGFKRHPAQQSEARLEEYLRELHTLARPSTLAERLQARLEWPLWAYTNDGLRMRAAGDRHIVYDFRQRQWVRFSERSPNGTWR